MIGSGPLAPQSSAVTEGIPSLVNSKTGQTLLYSHLARQTRRHILTLAARITTSDRHTRPSPVRAATITAENIDPSCIALNGTSNVFHSQVSDWHTGRRVASGATVLVVLLEDDAIVGDAGENDVGKAHTRDRAGRAGDGLDANTVCRVRHRRVRDSHVLDGVVVAAAHGADRQTVTAGAGTASEDDVLCEVLAYAYTVLLVPILER